MAQVHPFTNPFFKGPTFEASNAAYKAADPFKQYQSFFANNPWASSQMPQNWVELQQKFWQNFMELATWQQQTMQKNMVDSAQVMMHCMQLSAQPFHLYRYIRRNWQKPYVTLGAQALNASRLCTKMMTENMYAWQKGTSHHHH